MAERAGEVRDPIDGRPVEASNGATFDNVDPADEEVIGVCADGTRDDMAHAMAAARRAFDERPRDRVRRRPEARADC